MTQMITVPCQFEPGYEDDIFEEEEDNSRDVESMKRLLDMGFSYAEELLEQQFGEVYKTTTINPPITYGNKNRVHRKKDKVYQRLRDITQMNSNLIILLHPQMIADVAIIDDYYQQLNEPIFGREYKVLTRKLPMYDGDMTKSILGDLYAWLAPLEMLEDKLKGATPHHSTSPIASEDISDFTSTKLPEMVIPVSAEEFANLGVAELLIVDKALLGRLFSLDDLAGLKFGQEYEVFFHGKHR